MEPSDIDSDAFAKAIKRLPASVRAMFVWLQQTLEALRKSVEELTQTIRDKDAELAELRAQLYGQRSERERRRPPSPVPPEERERRRAAGAQKRMTNREAKSALPSVIVPAVAVECCPTCQSLGPHTHLAVQESVVTEHVPARIVRFRHLIQPYICPSGHHFEGKRPLRVGECAQYGAGLHAEVVVSKCHDAMPLNRLADRFGRSGLTLSRSVLTDVFHRSASVLDGLYRWLVATVASAEYVNADETRQPVMAPEKCRTGFIWTFITNAVIVYVFSATRSGETPAVVLGRSVGSLQVDGYTGYNAVTTPTGRLRAGCLAHARRYFHKATDSEPEPAASGVAIVAQLYEIERQAERDGITGTREHLALRQAKSKPILDAWKPQLEALEPTTTPKSPLGKAVRYVLNQWEALTRFLDDPLLPLDNNVAERALRIIALGRNSFRWVGHDVAGENLAILQTIVATCLLHSVNPYDYLYEVLLRLSNGHPASKIAELAPWNWQAIHTPPV